MRLCSHLCLCLARIKWGRRLKLGSHKRAKERGAGHVEAETKNEHVAVACGACDVALSGAQNNLGKKFSLRVQHRPPLRLRHILFICWIFQPACPYTSYPLVLTCTPAHTLGCLHDMPRHQWWCCWLWYIFILFIFLFAFACSLACPHTLAYACTHTAHPLACSRPHASGGAVGFDTFFFLKKFFFFT